MYMNLQLNTLDTDIWIGKFVQYAFVSGGPFIMANRVIKISVAYIFIAITFDLHIVAIVYERQLSMRSIRNKPDPLLSRTGGLACDTATRIGT